MLFTIDHYDTTGYPEYRYWLAVENLMLLTQYSQRARNTHWLSSRLLPWERFFVFVGFDPTWSTRFQ